MIGTKEFLIAIFFLTKSVVMNVDLYPYLPSPQVSISKSYNSNYRKEDILEYNKLDLILKIRGGDSEYNDKSTDQKAMEKLIKIIYQRS